MVDKSGGRSYILFGMLPVSVNGLPSYTYISTHKNYFVVKLQPRRPSISWAASKAVWPADRGWGFCPQKAKHILGCIKISVTSR